jgi:hypothetical protein
MGRAAMTSRPPEWDGPAVLSDSYFACDDQQTSYRPIATTVPPSKESPFTPRTERRGASVLNGEF